VRAALESSEGGCPDFSVATLTSAQRKLAQEICKFETFKPPLNRPQHLWLAGSYRRLPGDCPETGQVVQLEYQLSVVVPEDQRESARPVLPAVDASDLKAALSVDQSREKMAVAGR
jgi:hypothetical protein